MAKPKRTPRPSAVGVDEIPVVGLREACPCGSGRRYKACHGRDSAHAGATLVARPFAGLPGECDWVAMREVVPAATARLTLQPGHGEGREVSLATVLPLAWPALVRADGAVVVGLQTRTGSGDASRDVAAALLAALETEPGSPVAVGRVGAGPRLQDLLDPTAPLTVQVHDGFDFWLEGAELTDEVRESLDRANSSLVPTRRLASVAAAYWCRIGTKEHLRWVLPHDEEPLLDAFARLHAAGEDGLGDGTRLIGSFRACGLLVPVWDLAAGTEVDAVEEPATAWALRLEQALGDTSPLTPQQRRARAGLANRQVTLR